MTTSALLSKYDYREYMGLTGNTHVVLTLYIDGVTEFNCDFISGEDGFNDLQLHFK